MDADMEMAVKSCVTCQEHQKLPAKAKAPMHLWEWPDWPWGRLHIDYTVPVHGKMILVVVDAHSKWLEAQVVNTATSQTTIDKLRMLFATHGLPETVVSDNGSVFTSAEFSTFMSYNGIKHLKSAPYHPASNGLAERAVQTVKGALKKDARGESVDTQLARFLFRYCLTPHSTTGIAPAELLMRRGPRSRLDLMHTNMAERVREQQLRHKVGHDQHCHQRSFSEGELVWLKNQGSGPPWLPGTITRMISPERLLAELGDVRTLERHIDHCRPRILLPNTDREPTLNTPESHNSRRQC